MRIFLDATALAKRYGQEPGSEELKDFFLSVATEVCICTLPFREFAAALGRKVREKEIRIDEFGWSCLTPGRGQEKAKDIRVILQSFNKYGLGDFAVLALAPRVSYFVYS